MPTVEEKIRQQVQQQKQQKQKQQEALGKKLTYASITSKNINKNNNKNKNTTKTIIKTPTAVMKAWAGHGFQPVDQTSIQGYTFVYLNSPHRMPHSEVRKRLWIIGIP